MYLKLIPTCDEEIGKDLVGLETKCAKKFSARLVWGGVALGVVNVVRELGMRVIASDPFVGADYADRRGVQLVDMDTLLQEADFISIHVPLTEANTHLLGEAELAKVKTTARILNIAQRWSGR